MYGLWKLLLDKILATALFIVVLLVIFIISIGIKLTSKGPILFKQSRLGKNAKPFTLYKFRTMYVECEQMYGQDFVKNLIDGKYGKIGQNPTWKLQNDPRVTKIGQFLRKTSMDELPQLINVIKGDMSLIGPRPPLLYEYDKYGEWHKERLSVKPGITGLWQATGRSSSTFDEMVKMDIEYVKKQSISMDVKILFETVRTAISGKGAY